MKAQRPASGAAARDKFMRAVKLMRADHPSAAKAAVTWTHGWRVGPADQTRACATTKTEPLPEEHRSFRV